MTTTLTLAGILVIGDPTGTYQVETGMDFGAVTPDTTVISSLLLDGDVVSGERTGNRTWNFSVKVAVGTTRAALSAAVDSLLLALNVDSFPVVWTPTGCPSSNVMTRGRPTLTVEKAVLKNDQLAASVGISFETGPFMASASPVIVSIPHSGGLAQIQLDGMNSGSFTLGALNTTTKYEGAGSMSVTLTRGTGGLGSPSHEYFAAGASGRTISPVVDLSAYVAASVRLRLNVAGITPPVLIAEATLMLRSAGGSANYIMGAIGLIGMGDTSWHLCPYDLTAPFSTIGSFDPTAVTSWALSPNATFTGTPSAQPSTITALLDDLRVYPPGSVDNSTGQGAVYTVPSLTGSARTPVGLEFDIGGSTFGTLLVHSPPVDQDPDLSILVGLSGSTQTIPAPNMNYDGTYSVVPFLSASAGSSRTITATFVQKLSGTIISTQTVNLVTSTAALAVSLGEIALPLVAMPPENADCTLTITLSSTAGGSDVFAGVALCDTEGQTVFVVGAAGAYEAVWVDTPNPLDGIGPVYGSATLNRSDAVNIMGVATVPGGPFLFEPGNNKILVASGSGSPNTTVTYFPLWLDEAQV